ncbi:hypothetical protein SOVF_182830 [Spinacia oleracea]|nr:hypothetical protein SOVF_182830 [Spinacia oleracea]
MDQTRSSIFLSLPRLRCFVSHGAFQSPPYQRSSYFNQEHRLQSTSQISAQIIVNQTNRSPQLSNVRRRIERLSTTTVTCNH